MTQPPSSLSAMHPSAVSTSSRPADNELYDRGCDLVEAAASIRRLACDPQAARAVPAVLGCVQTALSELSTACDLLVETTERTLPDSRADAANARMAAMVERMRRGFANHQRALRDAEATASAARSLAARLLGA
jgi:hypothetical protein